MNTAIVNIKTDPKIKQAAQKIASSLGLSLSAIINGYLREFVQSKTVTYSDIRLEPTAYTKRMLKQTEKYFKQGKFQSFTPQEYLAYIDTLIVRDEKHRRTKTKRKI